MMHQIVLPVFAALLLLVQPLHSQSVTVFGKEVPGPSSQAELGLNFKDFTVYQVDVGSLLDRLNPAETTVIFDFQLGVQRWNFQMEKVALKAGGYSVRVKTPQGIQQAVPVEIYTYQGRGPSGQLAALTLAPDFVYGFFEIGDDSWFIEPVWLFDPSANRDEFVVYRAADVKPGEDVHCGVKEISKKPVPVNPGINKVNSCLEAEVAIASDYLLFTTLGSVSAVETRNIGVLNNVAVNYRHEFTDNVELILVEQFVDSALPEEWTTSTDPNILLDDFSAWGPTGFTATHDLATLWTGRDLNGTTIGLAWVDAVCATNYRYNICQYLGVSWQDRVLQAHEMGHNFSANHDASGSPYIMAPAINNTSIWSAATVTSLNTNLPTYGCLATCTGSPVASFLAEPVTVCTGNTVQFKDKSQNGFTRTWTFQNGTPSSSTAQQPTVTYSTTGSHDVTIVSGSSSLTQANYITVDDPTTATCTTSGGTGGLTYFALNTISNSTATGSYTDYSCSDLTNLATNTVYGISVVIDCTTSSNKGIRFFIDYNNDGDMSDAGELVATSNFLWCGGIVSSSNDPGLAFTSSSAPVTGQILRARV
ncbi:MAG: PKD domain-containing protein, partial [Gammaproteobacteria bacterium]